MIKGNGFFIPTEIGDFHPTLSGDYRPTLTERRFSDIILIQYSKNTQKASYYLQNERLFKCPFLTPLRAC
jgi:hypothetical protein